MTRCVVVFALLAAAVFVMPPVTAPGSDGPSGDPGTALLSAAPAKPTAVAAASATTVDGPSGGAPPVSPVPPVSDVAPATVPPGKGPAPPAQPVPVPVVPVVPGTAPAHPAPERSGDRLDGRSDPALVPPVSELLAASSMGSPAGFVDRGLLASNGDDFIAQNGDLDVDINVDTREWYENPVLLGAAAIIFVLLILLFVSLSRRGRATAAR